MAQASILTGRKVLAISTIAFLTILVPNILLAYFAVETFSGVVVDNSYVSSQTFDRERRAQEALGWTTSVTFADDAVRIDLKDPTGAAARPASIEAVVGRPTSDSTDRRLDLVETPSGYAAVAKLDPGAWIVMIEAHAADGTAYRRREPLTVAAEE